MDKDQCEQNNQGKLPSWNATTGSIFSWFLLLLLLLSLLYLTVAQVAQIIYSWTLYLCIAFSYFTFQNRILVVICGLRTGKEDHLSSFNLCLRSSLLQVKWTTNVLFEILTIGKYFLLHCPLIPPKYDGTAVCICMVSTCDTILKLSLNLEP